MNKIKILMFIDGLRSGGKERQIVEIITGFRSSNISLELVVMNENIHYKEILENKIEIHYLIRKTKKDITIFYKFFKLCKRIKPDLIHTWDTMTSVYAIPTAKIRKIKLLNGSIRNAFRNKNSFNDLLKKITLELSEHVLSNSYAGLKIYSISGKKGFCIHNGFNINRLCELVPADSIKSKFNISSKDKIVGMVGAFEEKKDYKTFINVALSILEERDDVTFLLVGDGRTINDNKKVVPRRFSDKIIFTGRQNNIESIINIFDIGVLLTNKKVHEEGISNSIMEYMVCAKPVIATEGGGTTELIEDSKNGFLFKDNSIENISNKIQFLLDNKDTSLKIGEEGKLKILKDFTLEKMIRSYNELYEQLAWS